MSAEEVASHETAERVMGLLVRQSRDGMTAASIRDLALELSIGRSTAQRALRRLERENRITVARRGSGHLYPTTYRLNGVI